MDAVLKSRRSFFVGHWSAEPAHNGAEGLFAGDTRHLNRVAFAVDGRTLSCEQTGGGDLGSLTLRMVEVPGPISVTATFSLGDALEVTHHLTNDGDAPFQAEVALIAHADFRDIFELRGVLSPERGELLEPSWDQGRCWMGYRARDGHHLGTRVEFDPIPERAEVRRVEGTWESTGVAALYRIALPAGATWSVTTTALPDGFGHLETSEQAPPPARAVQGAAVITDNPEFDQLLQRSLSDLKALVSVFPDGQLVAAGVPWYVAPFGRDSLLVTLQTLYLDPGQAVATLRALARTQGTRQEDSTGEEPGKVIHEARYGELARLGAIPHRPYYGTVDATPLFVLVAADTLAWTGDRSLHSELAPAVEAALTWLAEWGDRDGDGLIEYHLALPEEGGPLTARHQSWKDSDDSLQHPDGRQPSGDIAPIEAQGYAYAGLSRLAEVSRAAGDHALADRLEAWARDFARLVNTRYWMEGQGYYAQALDGDKARVEAIASNPGHLLFTGLVPPERTGTVVERMMAPDLYSGWGVRTLSTRMASYDPWSYHNGSLWPHDNWVIADGLYRTGHHAAGGELSRVLFDLGRASPDGRLDELYCGHPRDRAHPPVRYQSACRPQAWAAGVYPGLVRSMLGLRVDPVEGSLVVAPHLPGFLGRIEISGMHCLGYTGSLLVARHRDRIIVESTGLPVRLDPTVLSP